jgi:hypothetical protein
VNNFLGDYLAAVRCCLVVCLRHRTLAGGGCWAPTRASCRPRAPAHSYELGVLHPDARTTFAGTGTCSGSGHAGEERAGDLEARVGHAGVVASSAPGMNCQWTAAETPWPSPPRCPLLHRSLHILRQHRLLLRGDGARRGARHCWSAGLALDTWLPHGRKQPFKTGLDLC